MESSVNAKQGNRIKSEEVTRILSNSTEDLSKDSALDVNK
jgi:hypothetical protein